MFNLTSSTIGREISMEENKYRDIELFRKIASGDAAAFAAFFNLYAPKIATYVSKVLRSDSWAEEIVQDVFMKLWSAKETLISVETPVAFVYRMAINRITDYMRHREQEIRLQHYLLSSAKTEVRHTEEHIDFKMGEELYRQAVESLPKQRKLVFKMRHELGKSYDEIARELEVSPHTVRNLLNLAMQNLRTYLQKYGDLMTCIVVAWFFQKIF